MNYPRAMYGLTRGEMVGPGSPWKMIVVKNESEMKAAESEGFRHKPELPKETPPEEPKKRGRPKKVADDNGE